MADEGVHPRPQLSLVDLPPEILRAICTSLCHHCCEPTDPSSLLWPAPRDLRIQHDRSPLRNASLVCRKLRDAAQPVLFHLASFRLDPTSDWVLSDFLWRLLRSLRERPDLRPHMRHLDIAVQAFPRLPPPRRDRGSRQARQIATDMCAEAGLLLPYSGLSEDNVAAVLMQILLAILLNLVEIRLVYPRRWTFDTLRSRRALHILADEDIVPFLPTVQTLLLEIEPANADACIMAEHLCDCGVPLSDVDELLVEAAPNVRVLSCSSPGLDRIIQFSRLTHLQIWVRGTWPGELEEVMQGLPALTHFACWSVNMHGPTPLEVQRALESRKNTLECLSLSYSRPLMDCGFNAGPRFYRPPPIQGWMLDPFSDFPKLTSLHLDDHMIWHHVDGGFPAFSDMIAMEFRNLAPFLPPALEGLYIFNSVGMELPIEHLARSMADDTLPNLRKVFWSEFEITGFFAMDSAYSKSERWLLDREWRREVELAADVELEKALSMPFVAWQDIET